MHESKDKIASYRNADLMKKTVVGGWQSADELSWKGRGGHFFYKYNATP
jgi:GH15 family glucan-1,4-alpha-glucosidase